MCPRTHSSRATRRACGNWCASAGGRSAATTPTQAWCAGDVADASDGRRGKTVAWCSAMIDLLVGEDRRGFGIATALAIEGIPVRRIARAAEFDGRVLVASADQLEGAAGTLARQVAPPAGGGPGGGPRGGARASP